VGDGVQQLCAALDRAIAQSCCSACTTCHAPRRSVATVPSDPRRRLGQLGEQLAAEHLVRRGFEIVERNYRTRWGELDIVAYDGRILAFCEVKSRRVAHDRRKAFEALHTPKRNQVRKMAACWLIERSQRPFANEVRFDAIGVTFSPDGRLLGIEHLEGAF
jgi:putative endonuclease